MSRKTDDEKNMIKKNILKDTQCDDTASKDEVVEEEEKEVIGVGRLEHIDILGKIKIS